MDINTTIDSDTFDSVQYINQKFCTESSLENLDDFINGINTKIALLDEEISHTVRYRFYWHCNKCFLHF